MGIISFLKNVFSTKFSKSYVKEVDEAYEKYINSSNILIAESDLIIKSSNLEDFSKRFKKISDLKNTQQRILRQTTQQLTIKKRQQRQQLKPRYQKKQEKFHPAFDELDNIWHISFTSKFFKNLERVDNKMKGKLWRVIKEIVNNPLQNSGTTIKSLKGKLKDKWRARCGDYRLVYFPDKNNNVIVFLLLKHRKEVYI